LVWIPNRRTEALYNNTAKYHGGKEGGGRRYEKRMRKPKGIKRKRYRGSLIGRRSKPTEGNGLLVSGQGLTYHEGEITTNGITGFVD